MKYPIFLRGTPFRCSVESHRSVFQSVPDTSSKVTTTGPSLLTLMSVVVGLTFLTLSATLAFSASVSDEGVTTELQLKS